MAQTYVLIGPLQYVLHQLPCTCETIRSAFVAKHSQRDLVARTFALIAPVQFVLQQVSCSY